ncbi:hypothetical protein ICW40_09195, partial [Actinotalea ferrariae]|nr:hypothetical protein [Actinotalea ferrariae]
MADVPTRGPSAPSRPSALGGYEDWPAWQAAAAPFPGAVAAALGVPTPSPVE